MGSTKRGKTFHSVSWQDTISPEGGHDLKLVLLRNMRNKKRDMRKDATLAALISPTRQGVLTTLFLRPDKEWYLSELAASLGTGPSSLQREVAALIRVGILKKRVDGRRSYVKANEDSPIFPELRGLAEKTSGIVPMLRDAVKGTEGLQMAFIYGSLARGEEGAESDVDVMLLGDVSTMELSPRLRAVETAVGRQVNPTVFSLDEFAKKVTEKNHFLRTVLKNKKIMLAGTENELENIARRAVDSHAPVEQTGTR
ncbi:MAG: nucleotidyltransferase domain-containing protein [Acidobacteriaceae bacterium]